MTTKEFAEIIGAEVSVIRCWIRNYGLPAKKFKKHGIATAYNDYSFDVEQDKFWDWLEKYREKVSFRH